MTDDTRDPLVQDLEAIERSIPVYPSGLGTLRSLLASLPSAVEPDVQAARAGVADPTGSTNAAGAGGIATAIQGTPPGLESGGGIGILPRVYFGLANLLKDPAFEIVNTATSLGAYNAITTAEAAIATDDSQVGNGGSAVDVWFAQQIGATACTMTYAGRHFRSLPDFSPYNSSSLAVRLDATGSGTHELRVRSSDWDASDAPAYPYLIGAVRVTTNVVNNLSLVTSAVLTVEIYDVTSAVVRASTAVSIKDVAQFDQSTQIVANLPYAGQSYEGHTFRIRVRIVLVTTGNAAVQEWMLGEPQLTQGQTELPPPYAPVAAAWIPTRVRQNGLNSVEARTYPILSAQGIDIAEDAILWGSPWDLNLERKAAGILGIERDGASGTTGIDFREGASPGAPAGPAARIRLYANNDGHLHQIDGAGVDTDLTAGGGGGGLPGGGLPGAAHVGTGGAAGVNATAAESDHQHPAQIALSAGAAGSGNIVVRQKLSADANYRLVLWLDTSDAPSLLFGGGAAAADARLRRVSAGRIDIDTAGSAVDTLFGVLATAAQQAQIGATVSGDSQFRAILQGDATLTGLELGSGSATRDVRVRRSNPGVLVVDGNGQAVTSQLLVSSTAGQRSIVSAAVSGDSNARFAAWGDATLQGIELGTGGTRDVRIFRAAAGQAQVDSNGQAVTTNLTVEGTSGQASLIGIRVAGDSATRLVIEGDATEVGFRFGPGSAARDIREYRSGAKVLTFDDTAGGNITVNVIGTLQQSGTGVSVIGHGAADHANITRSVFLPAGYAKLDAATAANIGASPDLTGVVALADAATQRALWTLQVPLDWASGVLTIQPVWSPGATDAVAHTVRWTMTCKAVAAGSTVTAAGTTTNFTGASAARTVGVVVYDTATSSGITPAAAGDLFRLEFGRIGADAADTYVGVVNLLGLIVTYTANQ